MRGVLASLRVSIGDVRESAGGRVCYGVTKMTLDANTLEQAKQELNKLMALGQIDFQQEHRLGKKFVFVGIKLTPSLYKWMKGKSDALTKGNVNGFLRALLETLKQQEENTHHDHNHSRKRIPS